jgi:hypothetical protein
VCSCYNDVIVVSPTHSTVVPFYPYPKIIDAFLIPPAVLYLSFIYHFQDIKCRVQIMKYDCTSRARKIYRPKIIIH